MISGNRGGQMMRSGAIFLCSLCLFGLLATPAHACRCAPRSLQEYVDAADVVMQVRVVTRVRRSEAELAFVAASVAHEAVYKGAPIKQLRSRVGSAACGLALNPGQRLWVFGKRRPGEAHVWVDSCNGTRPVSGEGFSDALPTEVVARLEAVASALAQDTAPHTPASCWDKPRNYHAGQPQPDILEKITLERRPRTRLSAAAVLSPNQAYRFELSSPTASPHSPRSAILMVDTEQEEFLLLHVNGVAGPVEASWVNEKLIQLRIHWGRGQSTDALLDVEAGGFVYMESRWPGEQRFAQAQADGECPLDSGR